MELPQSFSFWLTDWIGACQRERLTFLINSSLNPSRFQDFKLSWGAEEIWAIYNMPVYIQLSWANKQTIAPCVIYKQQDALKWKCHFYDIVSQMIFGAGTLFMGGKISWYCFHFSHYNPLPLHLATLVWFCSVSSIAYIGPFFHRISRLAKYRLMW